MFNFVLCKGYKSWKELCLKKGRKDVCEKCNTIGPRPQGWHFSMTTLVGQSLAQLDNRIQVFDPKFVIHRRFTVLNELGV